MKKHMNVPVFIPHLGCPNGCVFCNQKKISGRAGFDRASVRAELDRAFATIEGTVPVQIAYFGGSFTGINREDMVYLLQVAREYIDAGKCESVRISTRPDYISDEILDILWEYGVRDVELGIQSMDDSVLSACKRGHRAADSLRAAALVKAHGFALVGQMMVGLPASTAESERKTAKAICDMGADGARIYPAVVFSDTALADMMKSGAYEPLTEESSILRAENALSVFIKSCVPVIRIGLQSGETLSSKENVLAGGYHPAVGELAYGLYFRNLLDDLLREKQTAGKFAFISVCSSDISKVIGQRGENRRYLTEKYALRGIKVIPDDVLKKYTLRLRLSEMPQGKN